MPGRTRLHERRLAPRFIGAILELFTRVKLWPGMTRPHSFALEI